LQFQISAHVQLQFQISAYVQFVVEIGDRGVPAEQTEQKSQLFSADIPEKT
jgi:hypothetical protein